MKALEGIKVLDLTRILSGPYCTMFLADMGADCIKIEPPNGDDTRKWGPPFIGGESTYYLSVNRNKKSLVLNLKTEEGKRIFLDLVKTADVVVENFRPGQMDKLGIGYDILADINPRVILASISGFGQFGKYSKDPGYDVIAQGMGGLMSVTGEEGRAPVKVGFSISDLGTGMWAIIGILTALLARTKTNKGQWIDSSLLDTVVGWQTYLATSFHATGENPKPLGNAHPSIVPYQVFKASDSYFNIGVGNDNLWKKMCHLLDIQHIQDSPLYETNAQRVKNRSQLIPILEGIFIKNTAEYWITLFKQNGIPIGPVYTFSELYKDEHIYDRELVQTIDHPTLGDIKLTSTPIKLSDTPGEIYSHPPLLGEHSTEILTSLGYSKSQIEEFYKSNVSYTSSSIDK